MNGTEVTGGSFWWIVPLIMMVMCFFMMRGRRRSMMCGFGSRRSGYSAKEILDKRYASGEINKDEYEEIKKKISNPPDELQKMNKGKNPYMK